MNCKQAQSKMAQLIDLELSEDLAHRLLVHIDTCPECEQHFDEVNEVKKVFISGLVMPSLSDNFDANLQQKIQRLNLAASSLPIQENKVHHLARKKPKPWQVKFIKKESIAASIVLMACFASLLIYGDFKSSPNQLLSSQEHEVTQYLLNIDLHTLDKNFIKNTQILLRSNSENCSGGNEVLVCDEDFLNL